jgi:tetratricopeptide (TPR) repeat protein
MNRHQGLADKTRERMAEWFEAKDVSDPTERLVVREVRQGKGGSEAALIDLGQAAERRGDIGSAETMYVQALQRNPSSWRAARASAELYRHKMQNTTEALRLYEIAAGNAPRRGPDRALIFREWGMLLRDSGDPEATDLAITNFETALSETPNDVLAKHALAHMFSRKGAHERVIELLEPLATHTSHTTRQKTAPLLFDAYRATGEMLKAAKLKVQMEADAANMPPTI